jgi:hypothetical protein
VTEQPCPECAQVERRVLITCIAAGALMGAGVAVLVLRKAK